MNQLLQIMVVCIVVVVVQVQCTVTTSPIVISKCLYNMHACQVHASYIASYRIAGNFREVKFSL